MQFTYQLCYKSSLSPAVFLITIAAFSFFCDSLQYYEHGLVLIWFQSQCL